MRTTLNLDAVLSEEALKLTGVNEKTALVGRGLGYIDIVLPASSALMTVPLWTLDKVLAEAASAMGRNFLNTGIMLNMNQGVIVFLVTQDSDSRRCNSRLLPTRLIRQDPSVPGSPK